MKGAGVCVTKEGNGRVLWLNYIMFIDENYKQNVF